MILAGVTIATLTGDNGILTKAQEASEKTKYTGAKEAVEVEVMGSFDNTGRYNADLAKENLENNLGATVIKDEDGTLRVAYEGYDFKVELKGEVSETNYFKLSIISDSGMQGEHTLGIDAEGNLWAWGRNKNGELGNGTTENSSKPIQIMKGTKFKKVDTSASWTSFAIDEDGNLWGWGNNSQGQLGNETKGSNVTTPLKIAEGIRFKDISAGLYNVAIDEEGNLWTWGLSTNNDVPIKTLEGTKFKKISAGVQHSLAIDEEGNLWSWGSNHKGQLGNGTTTNNRTPTKILEGTKFKEISAGNDHSLAIDEEGILWTWGSNIRGELGNGTTTQEANPIPMKIKENTKFQKVSAGGYRHSLAIDEDGNLW